MRHLNHYAFPLCLGQRMCIIMQIALNVPFGTISFNATADRPSLGNSTYLPTRGTSSLRRRNAGNNCALSTEVSGRASWERFFNAGSLVGMFPHGMMLLAIPRGFGGRTLKLLLGCHYTAASPDFPARRFAMMTRSTTRTWLRELAESTAKQACKDFGRKLKLLYTAPTEQAEKQHSVQTAIAAKDDQTLYYTWSRRIGAFRWAC